MATLLHKGWKEEDAAHILGIGIFELCVWPIATDKRGAFQAWVRIVAAEDFKGLPNFQNLDSVEEAKEKIEKEFVMFLKRTIYYIS